MKEQIDRSMSELEKKHQTALDIIARHFYVIIPVHLEIEKVENGLFTIREEYDKGFPEYAKNATTYTLSLDEIEVIYESMSKSKFDDIHSRDNWGLILQEAREILDDQD